MVVTDAISQVRRMELKQGLRSECQGWVLNPSMALLLSSEG